MGQNHERVLLDDEVGVGKALIQFVTVVIEDATEANGNVSERDDDVAADVGVLGRLQQIEQYRVPFVTILGANAKEFAERKDRCPTKSSVLFVREWISRAVRKLVGFLSP